MHPNRSVFSWRASREFINVAEVLGAIGLILPGLLRTRPGLTPLAAAGLVLISERGDGAHAGADPAGGGAPLGVRRLRPLAHARNTGTHVIFTPHAHQRHERG